jgi:hypothetical protein
VWGFNDAFPSAPGAYAAHQGAGLDYVVAGAAQRGLRLVIALGNFWPAYQANGCRPVMYMHQCSYEHQHACWQAGGAPRPGGALLGWLCSTGPHPAVLARMRARDVCVDVKGSNNREHVFPVLSRTSNQQKSTRATCVLKHIVRVCVCVCVCVCVLFPAPGP